MPAATRDSMTYWSIGLSAMANMALGRVSVNGLSLCPSPPARSTACFISRSFSANPSGLKNLGTRFDIPMGQSPGADKGLIADDTADVDRGINAGLHVIPDDCPQLAAVGIDTPDGYILFIQPEIGNLGA